MAANFRLLGLFLLTALKITWQASLPSDPSYYAGVVEFIPAGNISSSTMNTMLRMREIIESDDAKDLDILVFPEHVLNVKGPNTFVPDPKHGIAPCDSPDYDRFLSELSCSARSRGLYVVLNLVEKEACESPQCTTRSYKQYNTNVVLDRRGVVIARYRKTHLYGTEWYKNNVMPRAQHVTFTTDFGVTFGTFICFDMLFHDPAMVLVNEFNVTDIIYPTYWFSELPFLTAVQLQEGWSYANNVNLLAADASNPLGQNTGSGIYAGRLGRLTAAIYEEPTTRLLKARVPKRNHQGYELPPIVQPVFVPKLETPRFTKMSLLRDYNVDIFSTKLLADDFTNVAETVCHGQFCCNFDVRRNLIRKPTTHAAYRFRLAAYSGSKVTFQRVDPADLSVCALIACTTNELWSCGRIFPAGRAVGNKYYFTSLNISGKFRHAKRRLIMPSTVDAVMMPLPLSMYDMKEEETSNSTNVEITLKSPKSDILTFGIWANYYSERKVTHNLNEPFSTKSSASGRISYPAIALLLAGFNSLINYWN